MEDIFYEQKHLNKESTQEWISVKEYLPLDKFEDDLKGDYNGDFLCIVERQELDESYIYHSVELCYWNSLAFKFQDKNREWANVTHWTQIPKIPYHNSILTSRKEMLDKIDDGEFKKICHYKETDEFYQTSISCDLSRVSYNDKLYYSSTRNSEHIEDYMYCVLTIK
jgi:hypothetical protein